MTWQEAITDIISRYVSPAQAERISAELLRRWPGPEYLCRAYSGDVAQVIRPIYKQRARMLIRFSSQWLGGMHDARKASE